jgi:drug/metabolite transporter, DME family
MDGIYPGIFIALLWGLRPVFQKQVLNDFSPKTVMVIGATMYFLFVSIYTILFNKTEFEKDISRLTNAQIWLFILIGIIGFISSLIYYKTLSSSSVSKFISITSIWPLFAILFGSIILNEKPNKYLVIIVVLIVSAIIYFEPKNSVLTETKIKVGGAIHK